MFAFLDTEITGQMLKDKPQFPAVARDLNQWFNHHLQGHAGVLVSHNTAVDIQFLLCEYLRAEVQLPPTIKLGLDTCAILKRFSSLHYRNVSTEDWPEEGLTKKGNLSMGVKPCATYALGKRQPPESFEEACGDHHNAEADTRAVAVILFDQAQFPDKGLYQKVFKSKSKCFHPLEQVRQDMKVKMSEPVLVMETPPPGWVAAAVCSLSYVSYHVMHVSVTQSRILFLLHRLKIPAIRFRKVVLRHFRILWMR